MIELHIKAPAKNSLQRVLDAISRVVRAGGAGGSRLGSGGNADPIVTSRSSDRVARAFSVSRSVWRLVRDSCLTDGLGCKRCSITRRGQNARPKPNARDGNGLRGGVRSSTFALCCEELPA